jgi:hypothetical protein
MRQADKRLADRWPIMEAAALSTYTAAMQDEPEAIGPGDEDLQASPELLTSTDLDASVEVVEVTAR